jgi:hypothetical protein
MINHSKYFEDTLDLVEDLRNETNVNCFTSLKGHTTFIITSLHNYACLIPKDLGCGSLQAMHYVYEAI